MAEGAIGQTEAEKLLLLNTSDLKAHIEEFNKIDEAYLEKSNELEQQKEDYTRMRIAFQEKALSDDLFKMRTWAIGYVFFIVMFYLSGLILIPMLRDCVVGYIIQFLYWLITTVIVNWFSHSYFFDGLRSFFQKEKMLDKLRQKANA